MCIKKVTILFNKSTLKDMTHTIYKMDQDRHDSIKEEYEFFLKSVYTRPYELINFEYPLPKISNEINTSPFTNPIKINFNVFSFFKNQYIYLVPRFFKYPIKITVGEYNDLNEINGVYYTNQQDFEETLIKINYFEDEKYNNLNEFTSSKFLGFLRNKEKKFFLTIYNNLENLKQFRNIENFELQIICDYLQGKSRNYEKILKNILQNDMNRIDLVRVFLLLSNEFNICLLKLLEYVEGDLLFIFTFAILNLLENSKLFKFKKLFYVHLISKYILNEFLKNKNKVLLEILNNLITKYTLFDSFYFFIINLYINKETANEMFLLANSIEKQHLIVSTSNILDTEIHHLLIKYCEDTNFLENTQKFLETNEILLKINIDFIPENLIKEIQINSTPSQKKYEIINQHLFIYFSINYTSFLKFIKIITKNFIFEFEMNLNI